MRLGVTKPLAVAYASGVEVVPIGTHTTVGVTVGAPVSTWPGSRSLSVLAQRSIPA